MILPVGAVPELRDGDLTPLRDHTITARELKLMAFHPLGTARMAKDPADGVLDADGAPHKIGVAYADVMTGLYSVIAIQAALAHRDKTGEGQHIDMALLDTQVAVLAA